MSQYRWSEHDPYTGVTEINVANDDDDEITTHRVQDVEPLLAAAAETRNTGAADAGEKGMRLYASIPVTVQYELLKKGINVYNPDHMPRVVAEIEANYPKLKYTEKTHSLKPKPIATSLSKPSDSQTPENLTTPGPFVIVR